jgi:hypothetical protein
MRRILAVSAALLLALALAGCSKQNTADTMSQSSDSLLASNPVEQPAGDLTPQSSYEQPSTNPAETPKPAPKPTTKKPTTKSATSTPPTETAPPADNGVMVDAGTAVNVSVSTQITTETANVGDTWTGEIKDNVIVGDRVVFPAGSTVSGVVSQVIPAKKGERATLGLSVTSINANGTSHPVNAKMEPIIAGSTRARNVGAVAGGAGAGALIGKAVGGGKGALIGGLIGGAAAGTGVAASKGYQVVLKEGTVVTFSVAEATRIRS